jgi:hypothetical protein
MPFMYYVEVNAHRTESRTMEEIAVSNDLRPVRTETDMRPSRSGPGQVNIVRVYFEDEEAAHAFADHLRKLRRAGEVHDESERRRAG